MHPVDVSTIYGTSRDRLYFAVRSTFVKLDFRKEKSFKIISHSYLSFADKLIVMSLDILHSLPELYPYKCRIFIYRFTEIRYMEIDLKKVFVGKMRDFAILFQCYTVYIQGLKTDGRTSPPPPKKQQQKQNKNQQPCI